MYTVQCFRLRDIAAVEMEAGKRELAYTELPKRC